MFKGAGANILRGVAGAGVLSLYDKLQEVVFGKVYSGGDSSFCFVLALSLTFHQAPAKKRLICSWNISTFVHAILLRTFIKHRLSFSLFSCQLDMVNLDNTWINAKISVEQIKIIMCLSVSVISYLSQGLRDYGLLLS